jgi:hypothetical protein
MRYLRYASLAVSLAASALVAIVAVSILPQYWTYTSLVAGAVTVSWACLSAARAKRRYRHPRAHARSSATSFNATPSATPFQLTANPQDGCRFAQ